MQYRITSDLVELPRGTIFTTFNWPVDNHALALLSVDGHLIVGRWYENSEGDDYIQVPGQRIPITGEHYVDSLGCVVPVKFEFANITTLEEAEYAQFFANPFPSYVG
ncbi:MAG TPA: hypothetical protein VJ810_29910 [Blastocatellia bacterium]|nr:hypothetical protein [Blastocatellia bacterium]